MVEDEEALRKIASRTLEAAGYTVLIAANGEEALAACAHRPGTIHLLLTDVVMPRMSGGALAREIVRTRPTLKVLYMSGYTDEAIVTTAYSMRGRTFSASPSPLPLSGERSGRC